MQSMAVTIRQGLYVDLYGIVGVLHRGLAEMAQHWPVPEPEYPYALHHLLDCIATGLTIVAEDEGRIVGVLVLEVGHWPWAPSSGFLQNVHFCVDKAARAGGTAKRLAEAAKGLAGDRKMAIKLATCFGGSEAETKDAFVKSLGMQYIGGNFLSKPTE
jgi:GNAT superfamily N-acetyltransferase